MSPASDAPESAAAFSPAALSLHGLLGMPMVAPGDDLARMIADRCAAQGLAIEEGDVFVVAQKIVSKSEGAFADLADFTPGPQALELAEACRKDPRYVELVLRESKGVVKTKPGVIITEHRLGFICANAGIDRSNTGEEEKLLLLPKDPDASADRLARALGEIAGVRVGVVVSDSWGRPWRLGTSGFAIGLSGVPAIIDRVGEQDLFGRTLENTIIGLADQIAAAAALVMGEADEGRPVVLARGFGVFEGRASAAEAQRPAAEDMFR